MALSTACEQQKGYRVSELIPISLYIHFPWCVKKCPYCDFNSHTLRNDLPEQQYIDTLIEQLTQALPVLGHRVLQSIFLGGGTPSLFSGQAFARLLNFIHKNLRVVDNIEVTLEANPGTVERSRFESYYQAGINRISLGVQSFDEGQLKRLGRIHNGDEAKRAIEAVERAGFTNFNIDLMYGLPEQTIEHALDDLQTALSFAPPHLSWYQLTLEPNTYFYKFPPPLPHDEFLVDIEEQGRAYLRSEGLERYEISAYSKQKKCKHNLNYWQFGDYLGIGAGAHGKLTDVKNKEITRTVCYKTPKQYMEKTPHFYQSQTFIPKDEIVFEYMLNSLRLVEGVPIEDFSQRTFKSFNEINKTLKQALDKKLIFPFEKRLQPTELGLQFLNDLTLLFMSDS